MVDRPVLDATLHAWRALEELQGCSDDGRTFAAKLETVRSSGLFAACLPVARGGLGFDAVELVDAIEIASRIDGSLGWLLNIHGSASACASFLPEHIRNGLSEGTVIAGSSIPPEILSIDGERVGEWSFVSGASHATNLILAMPRDDLGDTPRWTFVDRALCEVIPTWRSVGLEATMTDHVRMRWRHLEEGVEFSLYEPPRALSQQEFPIFGLFSSCIAAVAVGIAGAAVTELRSVAQRSYAAGRLWPPSRLASVAAGEASVAAQRLALRARVTHTLEAVDRGGVSLQDRARLVATAVQVAQNSYRIVADACDSAGTAALAIDNRLDRCRRDVFAATRHHLVSTDRLAASALVEIDPTAGLSLDRKF